MSVVLETMSEEAYSAFREMSFAHHAAELVRMEHMTKEAAAETARQELEEMLPQGLATPAQHLFTIRAQGQNVGYLWFLTEENEGTRQAFLCDFLIFPASRRRGFGRAALGEMEGLAAELGCRECVLFVEDANEAAKALYRQCGYQVLRKHSYGCYMKKRLGGAG